MKHVLIGLIIRQRLISLLLIIFCFTLIDSQVYAQSSGHSERLVYNTGLVKGSPNQNRILSKLTDENASIGLELLSFDIYLVNNSEIYLNWKTASELRNDFFTLFKSKDGELWEILGEVGTKGNAKTIQNYLYKDQYYSAGLTYYRLGQTDVFGGQAYSNIKSIWLAEKDLNLTVTDDF